VVKEEPSIKSRLLDALIGWVVPLLCSMIPLLAWIDAVGAVFRLLGWRFVTVLFTLLVFAIAKLVVMWLQERGKVRKLNEKLDSDFRRRLVPVPGKGVYSDKDSGEIICPRCVAERNTPSPMAVEREYYVCGACGNMVGR